MGFGLLTIGNLRKPRYWALAPAEIMGRELVQLDLQGDGARSLVNAWASRKSDGTIDILVRNVTLDQSKIEGSELLKRELNVHIEQLEDQTYQTSLARIDSLHSNIATCWNSQDDWPTSEQWDWLHKVNTLDEQVIPEVVPMGGTVQLAFDLPMPGVVSAIDTKLIHRLAGERM
jgi:xylan 1,4-beta-xylosidase